MTADRLLVEDRDRVRVLTLNRPDKLNAFDDELLGALGVAMAQTAADDSVHVTVLTGAGRAFSVGADLSAMAQSHDEAGDTPRPGKGLFDDLQATLESFPKPLVAAVNGLGIGFGFTLLGYCDFTLVARSARLRTPFSQIGLSPEASSSYLFPLRMGWGAAARALMLGDWFSAEDVVACGLAQKVVEDAALMDAALTLADRLAQHSLQSLAATKRLMLEAHLPAIRAARRLEGETMAGLIGTPANRAAVKAFAARKKGS
ncbi:MAG TPA: enoyl-CoA hydratase-related protein [Sphingobium sp.]